MNAVPREHLDKVFGSDSAGETPEERARTSQREFVRGQTMLAEASPEASGRRLTALEALNIFGFDVLLKAIEDGQALLVRDRFEPSRTLKNRREALGYDQRHLARLAGLSPQDVVNAETPGKISPVRNLERLAPPLALDERILGLKDQTGGDALGVRLRDLTRTERHSGLSAGAVAALAESAWVIARQKSLSSYLNLRRNDLLNKFKPDDNYQYPTYQRGYDLAARTREILGIGSEAPVESMRRLVSDKLNIPLVQTKLGPSLAGATIANGEDRGIVVNIEGANQSVWVRRMTLAHELGHLLWDPAQKLNRLMIDRYEDLEVNSSSPRDVVEMRANAFAIAFLAPPAVIDRMIAGSIDITATIFKVVERFGISVSAASAHVGNIGRIKTPSIRGGARPDPSDELRAQEDFTIDYFPIKDIPPARVGRFALEVVRSLDYKLISRDTAATLLKTTPENMTQQSIRAISDLLGA